MEVFQGLDSRQQWRESSMFKVNRCQKRIGEYCEFNYGRISDIMGGFERLLFLFSGG